MKLCRICGLEGAISSWCKICRSDYAKKYHAENREKRLSGFKKYQQANKKKIAARKVVYYRENSAKWRENRERNRARFNAYPVNRRKSDVVFSTSERLRSRIRSAFAGRGWRKTDSSASLLGCTFNEARHHIESLFLPGMSWGNRNLWHIDHIIPLASAKTPKAMAVLCRYTNLQPLWAVDNFRKHAKMPVAGYDDSSVDSMRCEDPDEFDTEA